jgi:hypothetical protein
MKQAPALDGDVASPYRFALKVCNDFVIMTLLCYLRSLVSRRRRVAIGGLIVLSAFNGARIEQVKRANAVMQLLGWTFGGFVATLGAIPGRAFGLGVRGAPVLPLEH